MKQQVYFAIALGLLVSGCGSSEYKQDLSQEESKRIRSKAAPLLGTQSSNAIPGEYLIRLHDRVDTKALTAQGVGSLVTSFGLDPQGVSVSHVYGSALEGFAAKLSVHNLKKLRQDPRVMYIEQDQWVRIADMKGQGTTINKPESWGLDRIDQRDLPRDKKYTYGNNASTVNAYVLDTGILTTHTDFEGRATFAVNKVGDNVDGDCNGHGTHIGGTIGSKTYGVAKKINLQAVKVLRCDGVGKNAMVVAGIDWVTENAKLPAVANMSFVSDVMQTTDDAVTRMMDAGVISISAAGNSSGDACLKSPGHVPRIINVMASNFKDMRPPFSEHGKCADLFAPGDMITSTWNQNNNDTRVNSGTSTAAPHVTGAAAVMIAMNPKMTQDEVHAKLIANSTKDKIRNPGQGSPNRLLYVPVVGNGNPPAVPGNPGQPDKPSKPKPDQPSKTYEGEVKSNSSAFPAGGTKGFNFKGGTLIADLSSPETQGDFDLYLQKKNGQKWVDVASSTNQGHTENITLNSTAGQYRWEIYAYDGSGKFKLTERRKTQ